jgi:hypothetical protein
LAIIALAMAALVTPALSSPAFAKDDKPKAPKEFGDDWDNPRTAVAPIVKPDTVSCDVTIVDHTFDDFEPATGTYQPPKKCDGDWSKVVLRMEGAVAGRQFDRMGQLNIGDVPVFKTSTPEPSPDGITWTQEKDVTAYASLLRHKQSTSMTLGNAVDDTYTGVFDVTISLTFYGTDAKNPATHAADTVLPLGHPDTSGADLKGDITVPRNSMRLLADVYATGSGGGCEEFWYLAAPKKSGYSCAADDGPRREVQVLVDGELVGIAQPYPHVYTGGWSNPYLWTTLPAPGAFDIRPISYDLTPYLGLLNDGKAHKVTVHVTGVPDGTDGWSTPTGFRVWRDAGSKVVKGGVLSSSTTKARNKITTADGEVRFTSSHRHSATGWLTTSKGSLVSTVERSVSATGTHSWGADENPDGIDANWSDVESRSALTNGALSSSTITREYSMKGKTAVADGRLKTTMKMRDAVDVSTTDANGRTRDSSSSDAYSGVASYLVDVPRRERHATAHTRERVRSSGGHDCHDHTVTTDNGYVTAESDKCGILKPRSS